MFNRLPPELVRQIIKSAIPSTYRLLTYHDRQATLRSVCLVCRLFREIAQPLLLEFVRIDKGRKLDALLKTLERKRWNSAVRKVSVLGRYGIKVADLTKLIQSCQGLRSLTLSWGSAEPLDLSGLQDLPHLADLCLVGEGFQFLSKFRLRGLSSLSFSYSAIKAAPTLLNSEVLPSLRSLAMFEIYDEDETAYLNQSRLAELVPQLEMLSLDSRIIYQGLDYLVPALNRTLFEFYPPDPDEVNELLQVAQHLRIPNSEGVIAEEDISECAASIENQGRQISLRTIYLDIGLKNLSSFSVDVGRVMQDLLRACRDKRIEVIYEEQETTHADYLTASAEFVRRQRETRRLGAASK